MYLVVELFNLHNQAVHSKCFDCGPSCSSKSETTKVKIKLIEMKEVKVLIKYNCLHHVSLTVTNLKRAKDFYGNTLCLKEIPRPDFDFAGAWYEIEGKQIHLIVDPSSQTIRQDKSLSSREGHFALRVENYYDTLTWLKQNEIEIIEKPYGKSGFAQIFCADPDGNLIELNVHQKDL